MKVINSIIGLIFALIIFLLILSFINNKLNPKNQKFSIVSKEYKQINNNNLIVSWKLTQVGDGELLISSTPKDLSYKTYKIDKTHRLNISLCTLNGDHNVKIISCNLKSKCITSDLGTLNFNPNCQEYYCDKDLDGFVNQNIDGYCETPNCFSTHCQTNPGTDCDDNDPEKQNNC